MPERSSVTMRTDEEIKSSKSSLRTTRRSSDEDAQTSSHSTNKHSEHFLF